MEHDWEYNSSGGMYDTLYQCRNCEDEFLQSMDSYAKLPKEGCKPTLNIQDKIMKKFPRPLELPFLIGNDDTLLAIEYGVQWLEDNPDFNPQYDSVVGHVMGHNDETVAFHQEVFKQAGVSPCTDGLPVGVNFTTFAKAMLIVKEHGWDTLYEQITNIPKILGGEDL